MRRTRQRHSILALVLLVAACSSPTPEESKPPENSDAATPSEDGVVVLFLGDSLSAGYGLPSRLSFPALVETALRDEGLGVRVINAGVSGDTTAGGLSRLSWVLGASEPDVLVLQLGANDGLRGFPVEEIESNLHAIVEGAREAGARVLLTGMQMPPNYGPEYTAAFAEVFPRVAGELDLPFMPFLLDGVAARTELNLPDGIHPNEEGHRVIADALVPHVRALVEAVSRPAS